MTLTLAEAADLLKISADALLRKARAGTGYGEPLHAAIGAEIGQSGG